MRNLIATFSLPFFLVVISCSPLKKYADSAAHWEPEIQQLEKLDQTERYPDDAVLFVGSSSIRRWETIKEDMLPYPAIRRGYGGAHFYDLIHFTDRLVSPHKVSAVVCFVANDITGSDEDLAPKEVLRLFKFFVAQVEKAQPGAPLFQIEITPCNSRWPAWDKISEVNTLIRNYCEKKPNLYFISTSTQYLGTDGKPKSDLFVDDQLHLNKAGYDIWKGLIKMELDKVFP